MEIWKEIPGSGGKYQISNYGNVYSLINNVQLKGVNNGNGYLRVKLNERLFIFIDWLQWHLFQIQKVIKK